MTYSNLDYWQHSHVFNQDKRQPGEFRTIIVIAITGTMMVIEIVAGIIFGSMALLADGLHMASHAAALSINVFAYIYARYHAHDSRYSFGTGKVNALGGFTGAVLLVIFALAMACESIERIVNPVGIAFNQAIFVAVLGLIVNGASVFILGHKHVNQNSDQDIQDQHHQNDHHHDHNLRSAYLHVIADALTSFLAIIALLTAKYLGLIWMDPLMGIVGAILVSRWSLGLMRTTTAVLLDKQGSEKMLLIIKDSIENNSDGNIVDLHLWSIGPNIYSVIASVVTQNPKPPEYYKKLIPSNLGLVHVTIEVHQYIEGRESGIIS